MLANDLIELDRAHLVHPVASWRGHQAAGARILVSAEGATVVDSTGHRLIDGFAGLWCVNAGYGHDSVVRAAAEQMARLPYATGYFGLASEPPIRLAARLAEMAPGDLDHVYFTLGGSDAVDTTVRLVRYYWRTMGRPERDQFISVSAGYHGSSAMGAGLTAIPAFHAGFGVPLDWQHKIASPDPYRHPAGPDGEAIVAASLQEFRALVGRLGGPDRVAAFYAEPIQGSGGVIVPPRGWYAALRAECAAHGILFVADEVITGFGRTGPAFACAEEGVTPDFLTCAKGLTSGYVPMGAVLIRAGVFDAIADAAGPATIGHGQTYSAHPVSAAVAMAVLDLYEGGLFDNGHLRGAQLQAGLAALADHPLVGDVRGRGMLAALELVTDKAAKTPLPAAAQPATRIFARAWEQGLVIRAFAQGAIGFAPPLCCTEGEIDAILARTRAVLDETLDDPDVRAALR
jgi:adenosylmethionine-8-amino-7-oxononanoate aminotransferase